MTDSAGRLQPTSLKADAAPILPLYTLGALGLRKISTDLVHVCGAIFQIKRIGPKCI